MRNTAKFWKGCKRSDLKRNNQNKNPAFGGVLPFKRSEKTAAGLSVKYAESQRRPDLPATIAFFISLPLN